MKSLITLFVLLSCSAFATDNPETKGSSKLSSDERWATSEERSLLCGEVNRELEATSADMGLDTEKCETNQKVKVIQADGFILIYADLEFNDPNRSGFILTCTISYDGTQVDPEATVCQY